MSASLLIRAAPLHTALIGIVATILLEVKPKCIWTYYANHKTTKILLIFRFYHYILFIDSENLCFILILKEKMTRF